MKNVDVDTIDYRLEDVREAFNSLSDFILSTYDEHEVTKEYWSETCSMLSTVSMQLLNLTKKHWETNNAVECNEKIEVPYQQKFQ